MATKFKSAKIKPKKVSNDWTGQCDNCGAPLLGHKWIVGESTGHTSKCALEDYSQMLAEIDREDDI